MDIIRYLMVSGTAFAHPKPQQIDPIRVKITAFAHPTPTLQGRWANGPDSRSNCLRYSICPPYASGKVGKGRGFEMK
ncbi:hypothetical protein [Moorena sp. SIO4G3]|uniref:hypothetical protein n=1 Tax=Moorena sp. SIO4G3 TaxID=2607821 RepID=UPI00142C0007|nr:hypothetical protein [Moorena sp. SIO4G3]NEO77275.1 hypothetical protein [Moorena sp. SIO4G3]